MKNWNICNNLKFRIYQIYLQPSINDIENSQKQNMKEIKKKVELINYFNDNNTNMINGKEVIYTNNDVETSLDKRNKKGKSMKKLLDKEKNLMIN